MITKLKYVGVKVEDLLDIYILHIRSVAEYCSVVFHSRLNDELNAKLECIQRTCLKVILCDMYIDYKLALEMTGLDTFQSRRQKRCLDFSLKCAKHARNQRIFPLVDPNPSYKIRTSEMFKVHPTSTNFSQPHKISLNLSQQFPICYHLSNPTKTYQTFPKLTDHHYLTQHGPT